MRLAMQCTKASKVPYLQFFGVPSSLFFSKSTTMLLSMKGDSASDGFSVP